jgi:para-nitrobenzyl esterase
MSEDCLYLNVQTAAKKTTDRLPVMVWFHGGGLTRYSGNFLPYNTPLLAQTGKVVLVTISHRLGPFGYMAHPELSVESERGVSGNYGQLDLIAALKWVKKNIAAFGGDPRRVMIWGQSGGGSKVNGVMASPLSKGLFHRASCQAGFTTSGTPLEEAEQMGVNLMNAVGASNIAEMRSKPWQEIIIAANTTGTGFTAVHVVDGWYLSDTIGNIFAAGKNHDVPYIVGMGGGEIRSTTPAIGQLLLIMSEKQHSPIYTFVFTHVPSNWKAQGLMAYHTLELRYTFGDIWTIPTQFNSSYCCPPYVTDPDPGLNELDDQMVEIMQAMWTQFAATGNPSVKGLVNWPAYDNRDLYLDIGLPPIVGSGFSTLVEGLPAR